MTSDFGSLIDELETVALASREQRYPIDNVVPPSGLDIELLRTDLGYVRCAVDRTWFGPLEPGCPRCGVPRHE
jgi:hypothetical protein